MLAGYVSRVQDDIRRWQGAGWIDAATAERLSRDVETHAGRRISFGSILAMLAALLFAAGLLILVAADWESIPRPLRIGGIAALILLFLVGGALLKARGRPGFAEAAWLAGAASWGAGVILVGRMAGTPLDQGTAIFVWCAGTAVAAAAFPSAPLTLGAAALAAVWLGVRSLGWWDSADLPLLFPVLAAALWAVSLRSGSRRAREVLLLSLLLYGFFLAERFGSIAIGTAMAVGFAVLFALASRLPASAETLLRIDGHAPVHFLLGCFLGLAIVQSELFDGAGFALSAAVFLAAVAAALLLGGRQSAGVRRLCYLAFAAQIFIVLGVTVGSTLDTVSFFLLAAVVVAVLAVLVFRLERRWQPPTVLGAQP